MHRVREQREAAGRDPADDLDGRVGDGQGECDARAPAGSPPRPWSWSCAMRTFYRVERAGGGRAAVDRRRRDVRQDRRGQEHREGDGGLADEARLDVRLLARLEPRPDDEVVRRAPDERERDDRRPS